MSLKRQMQGLCTITRLQELRNKHRGPYGPRKGKKMITRAFAEKYRDSYESGMNVDEMVEFFRDCQKSAPEDKTFASLTDEDLQELAQMVIEMNDVDYDDD